MAVPSDADALFMKEAAESGHFEIEASALANTRATSADIKQFATRMQADHKAADVALTALAQKKGATLPTKPSDAQQATLKSLSGMKGENFDAAYAKEVGVKAHTEAVALFRKTSTSATDADVKAFAGKTLPTLEKHLEMAKGLESGRK